MGTFIRPALVVLALLAALSVAPPPAAAAAQQCSGCHSTSLPAGGHILKMPSVSCSFPSVVPPGADFNYTLKLTHDGKYAILRPVATIEVLGAGSLAPGGTGSLEVRPIAISGGAGTVTWRLAAGNSTGTLLVNASIQFTARHRHSVDGGNDENPFVLRKYSAVAVRPVPLYAMESDLSLPAVAGRQISFVLVSTSELRNITLTPSPNLEGVVSVEPASIAGLVPGQRETVRLRVADDPDVVDNGRLEISWNDLTGARNATFVMVRALDLAPVPVPGSPVRWMGRLTGLLSLCLLACSAVLGRARGGGKRRVRAHCAVSWFILGLSAYHGLSLVLLPYNRVWLGSWVVLGYISAAAMGFSSVNGLQRSWMTKTMGRRRWLWLHRISLLAAIALVAVHALMMGTDLRFIQDALRPQRIVR